jgi:hypothetical protein
MAMFILITAIVVAIPFAFLYFRKGSRYEETYNNGIDAYKNQNFDLARTLFSKAIKINKKKSEAYYNLD